MADYSDEETGVDGPVYGRGEEFELDPTAVAAEQQRIVEAAQLAAENQQALEQVPDVVKKYIIRLHTALSNGNVNEVQSLYERGWAQYTAEFYKSEEWPSASIVAPLVRNDEVFLTFYRWLYFRHLYSRFAATLDVYDRADSFEAYCTLFNYILNSDGPVPLDLPPSMLWDLVDEFLWQFGEFSAWRQRVTDKTEEDIQYLAETPQIWSAYSVLNVLYSLIQKSKIQDQLRAARRGEDMDSAADEFGARPLYRLLGYFSLLGLLRVHVLLSDFTLALKVIDDLDARSMASVSSRLHSVHAAHVSAYYHIGVAFLYLRRYGDAIDYLSRGVAHHHKNRRQTPQLETVNKVIERTYGLAAIAHALAPAHRLEDWVRNGVAEKHGEAHQRLVAFANVEDATSAAEEILSRSLPKFISPTPPPLPDAPVVPGSEADVPTIDPSRHQIDLILADVRARSGVAETRAYLKLYTTLAVDKLASLKGTADAGAETVAQLTLLKGAMREVRFRERLDEQGQPIGGLLDGAVEIAGDMAFAIDGNVVTVTETKRSRQVADYFSRRAVKSAEVLESLRSRPLPAARRLAPQAPPAGDVKRVGFA